MESILLLDVLHFLVPYTYEHPRPALTVDCVVFGFSAEDPQLKLLLIRRKLEPFQSHWALPGGFVRVGEAVEAAARRELQEETGVADVFLEQLYTFGAVDRDPREHVVTVAYYALVNLDRYQIQAATDAAEVQWFIVDEVQSQWRQQPVPPTSGNASASASALAFDHGEIVERAIARLRGKLRYEPIGFELLPTKFTLTQLQKLYEAVLGQSLDKRNFRKKILKMNLLIPLEEKQQNVRHRAAKLYQFDETRYVELKRQGFVFEL